MFLEARFVLTYYTNIGRLLYVHCIWYVLISKFTLFRLFPLLSLHDPKEIFQVANTVCIFYNTSRFRINGVTEPRNVDDDEMMTKLTILPCAEKLES